MRILFITDNFPPEVNAPATRTFEHCKMWIQQGAEVTVITCQPNFPQGRLYEGYKNRLYQVEEIEGIRVVRVWSFIVANEGFLLRVLDHLSFAWTAFWAGLFQKRPDVIVATSPQFFTTFAGIGLSWFRKRPWVFEVRDMWPEGIIFLKHESLVFKVLERIEKFLYRHADGIVALTESFQQNIMERAGIASSKTSVIYNGSNRALFRPAPKDEALQKSLNLEGKLVIGYAGTLGISHNLDFLIEQFPTISERYPDVHFLIMGDGAMREHLTRRREELKLQNLTLLPPVPKEHVPRYVSLFDIGLVPLKKVDAYLKVIPSKIFELAAMGKPILLGVLGESKNIIERYPAGLCFEPDGAEDFAEKVGAFYTMWKNKDLSQYQDGLDRLAEDFDRNRLAEKMLAFLSGLTTQKRG